MAQLFNGSICLTDIPKENIITSTKNGKKYLNLNLWVNDEPDQFQNIGSISIQQSKEEREKQQKRVYIGNFKHAQQQQPAAGATTQTAKTAQPKDEFVNDLPF